MPDEAQDQLPAIGEAVASQPAPDHHPVDRGAVVQVLRGQLAALVPWASYLYDS